MSVYEITGGKSLNGEVTVHGAKNSALPILAATLLIRDRCVIYNCPSLTDVDAALKILVSLGCVCVRDDNAVIIDATDVANYTVPDNLMREMRSSVIFLGAILSRTGKAVISNPGGCKLGARPIDIHIDAIKKLGVTVSEEDDHTICHALNGITGGEITLRFPSVGATENIIIAAAISKGTTVIKNAAREPEISDLADFLNSAGAKIRGAGSGEIIIQGVSKLHTTEYKVMPDRIVAATYMSAAAVTGGEILIKDVLPAEMISTIDFFKKIGCKVTTYPRGICVKAPKKLSKGASIVTGVYPSFPTDAGPLAVPVLCLCGGISKVKETVFENRFLYKDELSRFGADLVLNDTTLTVNPVKEFNPTVAACTDLRGGAALVIAALSAKGKSTIKNISHIKRGYCSFEKQLCKLGADIKEVNE